MKVHISGFSSSRSKPQASWSVNTATSRVVDFNQPLYDWNGYGYQWWHRSKNNQQWWEDSIIDVKDEHDMIFALGTGGQLIIIVKDLSLVVVTTASDYDNDSSVVSKVAMAIEKIIPLITNVKL